MTCPSCGAGIAPAPFCSQCGTALRTCAACGAANVATAAVCAVCGEPQGAAARGTAAAQDRRVASAGPPPAPAAPTAPRKAWWAAAAQPGRTRPSPPAQPPRAPQPPRSRPDALVGVARAVSWRTETEHYGQQQRSISILNFRVDRFGEDGQQLPSLAVEMRGRKMRGTVNDGEWVEIPGSWDQGELLEPRQVRNLTTNTMVGAKRSSAVVTVLKVIFTLIFLAIFLTIVILIISSAVQFDSGMSLG